MILREAGIDFEVVVSEIDERAVMETAVQMVGELTPADEAELLARAKAEDVASLPQARGALVLGCDSVFELGGAGYGKPYEADVAFQRWQAMRGNTGVLHTGHWLVDASTATSTTSFHWLGKLADGLLGGAPKPPYDELASASETVSSEVVFGQPTDAQIRAYVESGEPLHCAGAFTLEGGAADFIERVDGDREAVIGVSPAALGRLFERLGHRLSDFAAPSAADPTSDGGGI